MPAQRPNLSSIARGRYTHKLRACTLLTNARSLTPTTAKKLLDAGYPVLVERSPKDPNYARIFKDEEF